MKKVFKPNGETYYRYDYTNSSNMDEIIIKEPIIEGTTWTLKDGSVRGITAVNKKVGTEFGTFTAIEITTKSTNSTIRDYYVKNVGLVKSTFSSKDSQNTITSVLSKVETKTPFNQDINFYFPEFSKDKLVFISRNIKVNTNEDMKSIFEKELKTLPDDRNLQRYSQQTLKF